MNEDKTRGCARGNPSVEKWEALTETGFWTNNEELVVGFFLFTE